ncbi:MAG: T9SS type A sorting domain-containing protein [Saprospiraceae bacterium]|nr:T9SS type A sorting domain-containing protein [Saprospiraceae bacterium]
MTNYYQDNLLECDDRTATHPDNLDVNNPITGFESSDMLLSCNCENYPGCLTVTVHPAPEFSQEYLLFPNPVNSYLFIQHPGHSGEPVDIQITDLTGHILISGMDYPGNIDLSGLPDGILQVTIRQNAMYTDMPRFVQH